MTADDKFLMTNDEQEPMIWT